MSRVGFLYLGLLMLALFAVHSEDFFARAARGMMGFGRLFAVRFTILTAGMLLSWFCLQVTR